MNVSIVLKSLLITLPLLFLGGCASTTQSSDSKPVKSEKSSVKTGSLSRDKLSKDEAVKKHDAALHDSTVWFKFDNATIDKKYYKMLDAHAKDLVEHHNKSIMVNGYTDQQGTPEYNVTLSERRAKAVSKYLKANGVSSNQISIVSYGEEKPLDKGHTQAAYAENRRATIVNK